MHSKHLTELRLEERLILATQRPFEITFIQERRKRIVQLQLHRRAAIVHQPRRRNPFPRRFVPTGQVPEARHMFLTAPGFGNDVFTDQQTKLDPDSGEADAMPPGLGAGGQIVVAHKVSSSHPRSVVHNGQCG